MARIARRKKTFEMDGAKYIISPLTYDEVEAYGLATEQFAQKRIAAGSGRGNFTTEEMKQLRDITLTCIAQSLNSANDTITDARDAIRARNMTLEEYAEKIEPLELTVSDLTAEMDDIMAAKLFREVVGMTGLRVPTDAEVEAAMRAPAEGEAKASS
jgi:hypothetical protein